MKAIHELAKEAEDARGEAILDARIREFIKLYRPSEERDMREGRDLDFDRDLRSLIRTAYGEAAKPYYRQMTSMLEAVSVVTPFVPKR